MTKNPFINAIIASLYIVLVALIMTNAPKFVGPKESILVPIAVVSLFTLSAAVMGYLFLYQPMQLYFDNHKKEAAKLFLQTVASFAVLTVVIFFLVFVRSHFS